jgi:uncharacterized OB-fold protein
MTKLLEPPESSLSRPYWAASREERLVLPYCTACRAFFWYPRPVCPACLADGVEWRDAAGTGVVHAVTVVHNPGPGRDAKDGPYAVAIVELTEGVRVLSNVAGVAPEAVAIGTPVRVAWHPLSDGRKLPVFTPA